MHAGVKSPVVLLNPEGTVEAVSGEVFLENGCSLTSCLLDWNLNVKICGDQVADLQEMIEQGLV